MLYVPPPLDAAMFGCVLWSIWKQRNNKNWNDIIDAQSYVFDRAKTMLEDWKTTRSIQDTSSNRQQSKRNVKCMKPNAGRVKCNIDATFSELSNRVGIGVCIRDKNGTFVLAKTEWFSLICEVHVGEALGLLSALEWVHVLNLGPVDFEMDAKRVVDNFHSQTNDVTGFENIIDNCKSLFRNFYENPHVEFVRRQANEVAHALAMTAILEASFQVLVEMSYCIEHILSNKMQ